MSHQWPCGVYTGPRVGLTLSPNKASNFRVESPGVDRIRVAKDEPSEGNSLPGARDRPEEAALISMAARRRAESV